MIAGKVSSQDMEEYNNQALKDYNEKALDACPNCGRTFLPDRLLVHLRSCNKAHGKADEASSSPSKDGFKKGGMGTLNAAGGGGGLGGGGSDPMSKSFGSPSKTIAKPKTLVCYIWLVTSMITRLPIVGESLAQRV
jgi:hypothetical protein